MSVFRYQVVDMFIWVFKYTTTFYLRKRGTLVYVEILQHEITISLRSIRG